MLSSPTSDVYRLRRALLDPWALGLALAVAVVAALLGWGVPTAVLASLSVVGCRVAAEYGVPRSTRLAEIDSIAVQTERIRASLGVTAASAHRLPAPVPERVEAIRSTALGILDRAGAAGIDVDQLFAVLSTATDYLPAAVDAYQRLPEAYARERALVDGRTPLDVLVGQLDVLETEMVAVADAVAASDLNRLLAHGRFLADRFRRSELTFDAQEASHV